MALRVGGCWPAGFRSGMPEFLRELEDMKYAETGFAVPVPAPAKVSSMDRAFTWIRLLPAKTETEIMLRKLVWARCLVSPRTDRPIYSWKRLGEVIGCSENTAKTRWIDAVARITAALNRPGFCVAAGGMVGPGFDTVNWSRRPARVRMRWKADELALA